MRSESIITKKIALPLLIIWTAAFVVLLSVKYEYLVTVSVKDDAFYYYQIAHNLWHGHGLTFDGQNQTNGFQPLWFACNLLFGWWPAKYIGFKMVLALGFMLHVLTAYILYLLFCSFNINKITAIISSVVYLACPVTVMNALNGMESSLSLLCLVLLLYVIVNKFSDRLVILFSVLTILARLDYAILIGLILWWHKPNIGFGRIIGMILLFLIPYFVFNVFTGGSLMPISAYAVPLVIGGAMHSLFLTNPMFFQNYYIIAIVLVSLALLNTNYTIRRLGMYLSIGCTMFIIAHIIRGPVRLHYFVFAPLFIILLAVPVLKSKRILTIVLTNLLFVITIGRDSYAVLSHKQLRHQLPIYQLMTNINIRDTDNATIGCWNAGIPGFFCRYRVVNLDGCVNNTVYYILKERRLIEYCVNEQIDLIIDKHMVFLLYKNFYGYRIKFHVERSFGDILVCTYNKPGEEIQQESR